MCSASELRARARASLKGCWGTAIIVSVLAALLSTGLGGMTNMNVPEDLGLRQMEAMGRTVWGMMSAGIVFGLLAFVIGGAVEMGYAHFNVRLVDGEPVRVGMLFAHFDRIGAGICMVLWRTLFLMLWLLPLFLWLVFLVISLPTTESFTWMLTGDDPAAAAVLVTFMIPQILVLSIPMVIASYRYLLMPYLMAENPGLTAREAMRLSKKLMRGNKWRAFCLRLSFIGWELLCMLTFGIGLLWLQPYIAAADAEFYREVCRHRDITQPESFNRSPEF